MHSKFPLNTIPNLMWNKTHVHFMRPIAKNRVNLLERRIFLLFDIFRLHRKNGLLKSLLDAQTEIYPTFSKY